jgi:hypothetical protein
LRKLQHAAQVLGLEPAAEFLRQLFAKTGDQLGAVTRAFPAKNLAAQAFAHRPVKPRQLGVDGTGQALARADDEFAQLGVQRFGAGCDIFAGGCGYAVHHHAKRSICVSAADAMWVTRILPDAARTRLHLQRHVGAFCCDAMEQQERRPRVCPR